MALSYSGVGLDRVTSRSYTIREDDCLRVDEERSGRLEVDLRSGYTRIYRSKLDQSHEILNS